MPGRFRVLWATDTGAGVRGGPHHHREHPPREQGKPRALLLPTERASPGWRAAARDLLLREILSRRPDNFYPPSAALCVRPVSVGNRTREKRGQERPGTRRDLRGDTEQLLLAL